MGDEERIMFVHTVVEDAFEGTGSGVGPGQGRSRRRTPGRALAGWCAQCPFIRKWIEGHPDYQDLLRPPETRAG